MITDVISSYFSIYDINMSHTGQLYVLLVDTVLFFWDYISLNLILFRI